MRFLPAALPWRRAAAELAFLVGMGLVMGVIGPYGSDALRPGVRYPYWLLCIVGGGVIGIAIDEALGRRLGRVWLRIAVVSLVMTPFVAGLVLVIGAVLITPGFRATVTLQFLWQVLVISLLVMALRVLTWRPPRTVVAVETRTVIAPPLPEAEAAFRRRLSARRRTARLIAVQAEDHYLRVHTDAGEELITARFAEALQELAAAHGFQTHRSWWIAADAIETVQWRKGTGEARLAGGLAAPVSRTHAPSLKAAGWR